VCIESEGEDDDDDDDGTEGEDKKDVYDDGDEYGNCLLKLY